MRNTEKIIGRTPEVVESEIEGEEENLKNAYLDSQLLKMQRAQAEKNEEGQYPVVAITGNDFRGINKKPGKRSFQTGEEKKTA